MRNSPEVGVVIALRLTDSRGRRISSAVASELKVKVWTQDPRHYLVFYSGNIRQGREGEELLEIPEFEMVALAPGVIVYQYSFLEHLHDIVDHRHHSPYEMRREHTVFTDIMWRGAHGTRGNNPMSFQTLEYLKDQIDRLGKSTARQVAEIRGYVRNQYTGAVEDEIERAKGAETEIERRLAELEDQLKEKAGVLEQSISGLRDEDTRLSGEIQGLQKNLSEVRDTLEQEIERVRSEKALKDAEQDLAISNEASRAKTEEARIEAKIDSQKLLQEEAITSERARAQTAEELLGQKITANTEAISSEKTRASLVEKDLAESLQKLKNVVSTGFSEEAAALTALKELMKAEIESRIKDLVGTAPAALDTLGELAEALEKGDGAIEAINAILNGKANREEVYSRGEINAGQAELELKISKEAQRAELAERLLESAIDVINGDADQIGSIAHAERDANHYTDDAIGRARTEILAEAGATAEERAKIAVEEVRKGLQDQIDATVAVNPVSIETIRGWFSD